MLYEVITDLAAALNRVRAERGLATLPLAALRPYASHGAHSGSVKEIRAATSSESFAVTSGCDAARSVITSYSIHYTKLYER